MLGTSRTNPYDPKNDRSKIVLENIERYHLDYLVAIGGEDTLGVAHKLYLEGVKIVGIPKTIDKDLSGTDYTLGFETAVNVITEEIDRLRTTAGSHRRIFIVETMGRHAGWLALEGGESSGAYIILIPEYNFEINRVNELLLEGREKGARYEIIVVAEGAQPAGCPEIVKEEGDDSFGHKILGGIGEFLAKWISQLTKIGTLLASVRNQKAVTQRVIGELENRAKELPGFIEKLEKEKAALAYNKAKGEPAKGKLIPPVQGKVISLFKDRGQNGIEIKAAAGTEIRAVLPGRVLYADWFKGFGNVVIIDHGDHIFTVSGYSSQLLKKEGDTVTQGEPVALVGSAGSLKGPCLYFEIRRNGKPEDPVQWIPQLDKIVALPGAKEEAKEKGKKET